MDAHRGGWHRGSLWMLTGLVGWMLTGLVGTEGLYGGGSLGVPNLLIALLECVSLEALPGEGTSQEVEQHVTQGL